MRLAAVVVVAACSASPRAAPAPVAVMPTAAPPPDAAIEAAIDAAIVATPDAAPVTRFHAGDVVGVLSHNDIYDTKQAIAGTTCLAVMPYEPPNTFVADFTVGTVVAVSTTCPGDPETLAVKVGDAVVPIRAASVRQLDAACLPAVAAMYDAVLPAWDRCRAKTRWKNDLAAVQVRFTASGGVDDVAYQGGTSWGPKVARCIINAAKNAKLAGTACAGATVYLEQKYY